MARPNPMGIPDPTLNRKAGALFPMRQPDAIGQRRESDRRYDHPAGVERHVPMIDGPCHQHAFDYDYDPRDRHEPAQPNRRVTNFQWGRCIH
jgi:hypothetical protein